MRLCDSLWIHRIFRKPSKLIYHLEQKNQGLQNILKNIKNN